MEYTKATSEKTFFDKIFEAFKRSFSGFGNFLTELCVFVILAFPYVLIITIIIVVVVRCKKNKKSGHRFFLRKKDFKID